jgi:hypothetical protein
MIADFRKTFQPTEEEIALQNQWLKENKLPNKEDITLKPTHDGLYVANPICDFNGQCTDCKNYTENSLHYVEGGQCKLHKCSCGWGFTCDDFTKKVVI